MIIQKTIAWLRFYHLKYFKKNIVVKTGKPFFVGGSANISTKKGNSSILFNGRARIEQHTEIKSSGELILGHDVILNQHSRIIAHDNIRIGDNVVIARFVSILDHDHAAKMIDGKMEFDGYHTQPIAIGNNVWIGDKVTILKGVSIGSNVIIGANSVVNKNIPDNCVAAGVPCKIIKQLN